jgi:hypothetical protein
MKTETIVIVAVAVLLFWDDLMGPGGLSISSRTTVQPLPPPYNPFGAGMPNTPNFAVSPPSSPQKGASWQDVMIAGINAGSDYLKTR